MKKLLFLTLAMLISTFTFANETFAETTVDTPSELAVPGPSFKLEVMLQMGDKSDGCEGWWPVCKFYVKVSNKGMNEPKSLPSVFECYEHEVVIKIAKADINKLESKEPSKNLIGVKNVVFGESCEFPDEVIKKCGLKGDFGINKSKSYEVTSDTKYVYIHVPI